MQDTAVAQAQSQTNPQHNFARQGKIPAEGGEGGSKWLALKARAVPLPDFYSFSNPPEFLTDIGCIRSASEYGETNLR